MGVDRQLHCTGYLAQQVSNAQHCVRSTAASIREACDLPRNRTTPKVGLSPPPPSPPLPSSSPPRLCRTAVVLATDRCAHDCDGPHTYV